MCDFAVAHTEGPNWFVIDCKKWMDMKIGRTQDDYITEFDEAVKDGRLWTPECFQEVWQLRNSVDRETFQSFVNKAGHPTPRARRQRPPRANERGNPASVTDPVTFSFFISLN